MPIMALLVYLVIAIIVFGFAWWAINNFVPEPMRKFAILVMALIGVILIVYLLLGMVGGGAGISLPHTR
jgi:hypothetical protein